MQNIDDNEWIQIEYSQHKIKKTKNKKKKITKKNSIGINVFSYENKEKHPIYVSKNIVKKNILTYYW